MRLSIVPLLRGNRIFISAIYQLKRTKRVHDSLHYRKRCGVNQTFIFFV